MRQTSILSQVSTKTCYAMLYFVRYQFRLVESYPGKSFDGVKIIADVYPAQDWQIEADHRDALNPGERIVSHLGEVYSIADEVRDHTVIMVDPDQLPF